MGIRNRGSLHVSSDLQLSQLSFNDTELDYDASLLLLWTSPGVDTAAIDTGDVAADLQSGQELMIMGWGATSENGGRPKAMHVVSLPYVSQLVCKSRCFLKHCICMTSVAVIGH